MFEDIPVGTVRLEVNLWWCGHDYCDCHHFEINAHSKTIEEERFLPWLEPSKTKQVWNTKQIWEGDWWEGCYFEHDEILSELKEACNHYGIELKGTESESPWDWEGELCLSNTTKSHQDQ